MWGEGGSPLPKGTKSPRWKKQKQHNTTRAQGEILFVINHFPSLPRPPFLPVSCVLLSREAVITLCSPAAQSPSWNAPLPSSSHTPLPILTLQLSPADPLLHQALPWSPPCTPVFTSVLTCAFLCLQEVPLSLCFFSEPPTFLLLILNPDHRDASKPF